MDRPRCTSDGLENVNMFGMTINNVTLSQVLEAVSLQIARCQPGFILTPNVDHVCEFQENEEFRQAYASAFLVVADGMPILWASKLLRRPLKAKLSGSDLVFWLSEYAALRGYSIFLLGASQGVAEQAGRVLQQRYPGLKVAGSYSPPMGFDKDPVEVEKVIQAVRQSQADICFVALGAPKQDLFNYRYHQQTGVPVSIGVGIALSFVTGDVKRAPRWIQRVGLEWAWRLLQEPRRLAHRYLVRDTKFLPLFLREFWLSFYKPAHP